jgi:hypothetical protein
VAWVCVLSSTCRGPLEGVAVAHAPCIDGQIALMSLAGSALFSRANYTRQHNRCVCAFL